MTWRLKGTVDGLGTVEVAWENGKVTAEPPSLQLDMERWWKDRDVVLATATGPMAVPDWGIDYVALAMAGQYLWAAWDGPDLDLEGDALWPYAEGSGGDATY